MGALGYQVSMQALVSGPSLSPFDLLTGENADKKTASLYFDIYGALGGRVSGPCVRKRTLRNERGIGMLHSTALEHGTVPRT